MSALNRIPFSTLISTTALDPSIYTGPTSYNVLANKEFPLVCFPFHFKDFILSLFP